MDGEDCLATPVERAGKQQGRDRGFTFVETVLTVVLMGIVIVPVLAAVRGAVRVSSVAQAAAEVETVLVNTADVIQRAPDAACDLSADAQAAAPADWPSTSVTVVQQYLDVQSKQWVTAPNPAQPLCPNGYTATDLVKRISVTVTSPDGKIVRKIQVVKSNV